MQADKDLTWSPVTVGTSADEPSTSQQLVCLPSGLNSEHCIPLNAHVSVSWHAYLVLGMLKSTSAKGKQYEVTVLISWPFRHASRESWASISSRMAWNQLEATESLFARRLIAPTLQGIQERLTPRRGGSINASNIDSLDSFTYGQSPQELRPGILSLPDWTKLLLVTGTQTCLQIALDFVVAQ